MSRVKTKGVVIDTGDMRKQISEIREEVRVEVASIAAESLQAQIDAINAAATNRRAALDESGIKLKSSGTTDQPLKDAEVVISARSSSAGTRGARIIVYVKHRNERGDNIFNVLDAGTKNRRARDTFVFPVYEGRMIPDDPDIGDPDKVGGLIKSGNVKLKRNNAGDPVLAAKKKGQIIKGIEGRNLYKAAADYAENLISSLRIKSKSGKRFLKIKKGEVIVTVPSRPSFEE